MDLSQITAQSRKSEATTSNKAAIRFLTSATPQETLDISCICIDGSSQPGAELKPEVVSEYTQLKSLSENLLKFVRPFIKISRHPQVSSTDGLTNLSKFLVPLKHFPPQYLLSGEGSCFFSQSLIASSSAAACVISRRAQATSKAILTSLGTLPRTSLISSLITPDVFVQTNCHIAI